MRSPGGLQRWPATEARRLPDGSRLVQKKDFQALYGPTGRLERVLKDADGDGYAEAIVFYRSDGKPEHSELDTDGDHVLDRWEYADEEGFVYRTDFDDDGDGQVDRTEQARR